VSRQSGSAAATRGLVAAAIVAAAIVSGGCSWFAPRLPIASYPVKTRPPEGFLIAGAGKSDITPPPGFPTGGHGPAGSLSRGSWGRLHARAFYLQAGAAAGGERIAFVSADLFAIPGGLARAVAREVGLPAAALVLAATHTHHGPGNYLTSETYNQFGSALPNFSPELFRFLTVRIAGAVAQAIHSAKGPAELTVRTGVAIEKGGYDASILRNRSPRTFLMNRDQAELLAGWNPAGLDAAACGRLRHEGENATDWDLEGCPRIRAVDQGLTAVQLSNPQGAIGTMVFFAAHPTVLDHGAPLYSADFVGVALGALEREYGGTFGFFNGAEGDVTPRRTLRDLAEVQQIGAAFAVSVEDVLGRSPVRQIPATAVVKVAYDNVRPRFLAENRCPRSPKSGDSQVELAQIPVFGAAGLGGGEDDRTVLYDLGWREGARQTPSRQQGPKLPALDSKILPFFKITWLVASPNSFPTELPFTSVALGDFTVATVPFELSTAAGQQVRAGRPHGTFELIGLANEYSSYAATPDEYVAQDYMGASTLWGVDQVPFTACKLNELPVLAIAATNRDEQVKAERFAPGKEGIFGPEFAGDARLAADEELEKILLLSKGVAARRFPCFLWDESLTGNVDDFAATARRVTILDDAGREVDGDGSFRLITTLMEAKKAKESSDGKPHRQISATWFWPPASPPSGLFRFRVEGPGLPGGPVVSKPFSPAAVLGGATPCGRCVCGGGA